MKIKKLLFLSIVLIMSFAAVGCREGEETDPAADLPQIKYTYRNNARNNFIVRDDNYKYMAYKGSVYRAPLGTNDFRCIYENENIIINKIALAKNKIYFSTVNGLYTLNTDGSEEENIFTFTGEAETIYWESFETQGDNILLKKGDYTGYSLVKTENGYSTADRTTEKSFVNSRGMKFEFINSDEKGRGTLLSENGNKTIPADAVIINESSFMLTDNSIIYITGNRNDFSGTLAISICDLYGNNPVCLTESSADIRLITYDDRYAYFHDFDRYYRIDLHTFQVEKTAVSYTDNGVYEICDGWLYKVYALNPVAISLDNGETINLNLE